MRKEIKELEEMIQKSKNKKFILQANALIQEYYKMQVYAVLTKIKMFINQNKKS